MDAADFGVEAAEELALLLFALFLAGGLGFLPSLEIEEWGSSLGVGDRGPFC